MRVIGGGSSLPATVSVADSVFEGNFAAFGAGIWVSSGFRMTVDRTAFVDNVIPRQYAAAIGGGASLGGGGDATFTGCNFTGNYAFNSAGGACDICFPVCFSFYSSSH